MARVLVVEDEGDTRRVLCESLSSLGHEPAEARDGMEALERFQEQAYDVVITDMAMPRMDGIELTRRLKAMDPGLPVVMVTGQGSLDLMVRAVNRGVSDYLRKPFRLGTFEQAVERALDRRGGSMHGEVGTGRWSRLLRWLLVLLAAGFVLAFAWGAWQQEAGLQELARRVVGTERPSR